MSGTTGITELNRLDSLGLMRVFGGLGSIQNSFTGLGTGRDPGTYNNVDLGFYKLSREELSVLTRKDGLIKRAVELFPEDASQTWFNLNLGKDTKVDSNDFMKYMRDFGKGQGRVSARLAFYRASLLARQYGQAYIIMGIADGSGLDEPVDINKIESVRWLKVMSKYDLIPEPQWNIINLQNIENEENLLGNPQDPELYVVGATQQKIHRDRILVFTGNIIQDDRDLINNEYSHDSIIQSMYNAFTQWYTGLMAGGALLSSWEQSTLGMKGLGRMLQQDAQSNTSTNEEYLLQRGQTLSMGKSVLKTLLYDLENEEPGSQTHTYQGADAIIERLEKFLSLSTNIPRFKLFNEQGSAGLGGSVQAAQILRFEWVLAVKSFMTNNWLHPIDKLLNYIFLASDSPTSGVIPDGYSENSIEFSTNIELSQVEEMDIENTASMRSKTLVDMKAVSPLEIRRSYDGTTFNSNITLIPGEEKKLVQQQQTDLNMQDHQLTSAKQSTDIQKQQFDLQKQQATDPDNSQANGKKSKDQIRSDYNAGLLSRVDALVLLGYDEPEELNSRNDDNVLTSTPINNWLNSSYFAAFDDLHSIDSLQPVYAIFRSDADDIFAIGYPTEEIAESAYLQIAPLDSYLGIEEIEYEDRLDEMRIDRQYVRDAKGRFAKVGVSSSNPESSKVEAPDRITTKTNIAQLKAIADKHGIEITGKKHLRASYHEAIKSHDEGKQYFEKKPRKTAVKEKVISGTEISDKTGGFTSERDHKKITQLINDQWGKEYNDLNDALHYRALKDIDDQHELSKLKSPAKDNPYLKGDYQKLAKSRHIAGIILATSQENSKLQLKSGVVDSDGNLQAAYLYSIEKNTRSKSALQNHVYIQDLATTPWNVLDEHPKKVKGAGTHAIIDAINISKEKGLGGAVALYPIPTAKSFYEKLGFEPVGGGSLDYILTPEKADSLLSKVNSVTEITKKVEAKIPEPKLKTSVSKEEIKKAVNEQWSGELNKVEQALEYHQSNKKSELKIDPNNEYFKVDEKRLSSSHEILSVLHQTANLERSNTKSAAIFDSKGNLQANFLYTIETNPLLNARSEGEFIPHLFIHDLATSPWNNLENDPRKVRGAGTEAIISAIKISKHKGLGGAIELEALNDAVPFYKKMGFEKTVDDLWRLEPKKAEELLTKLGK